MSLEPTNSLALISASLYNFNIDDDEIKPEHRQWLDENAVPLLRETAHNVWLHGTTSSSGSDEHNLDLSKRRVAKVAAYLNSRGVGDWQMQLDWVGEEQSRSINQEDEEERSVQLRIQLVEPGLTHPQKPLKKPPPVPPVSRNFAIRLVGSVSYGKVPAAVATLIKARQLKGLPKVGPAVDGMFFEIMDREHPPRRAFYFFFGGGIGVGWFSISPTLKGPWNAMRTSKAMNVSQFEGRARFKTVGALKWTTNTLYLPTPKGVHDVEVPLETGITLGAGISSTIGSMTFLYIK